MTHPGWIGGFPGDWSYYGNAKIIVGDITQLLTVSLRLIFVEEAEIDVNLFWQNISRENLIKVAAKMQDIRQQVIVLPGRIFLIGFSRPPLNTNNGRTNFKVTRFVTYSKIEQNIPKGEDQDYFVSIRAYLNDEFSSMDEMLVTEFENTLNQSSIRFNRAENELNPYCALSSGYEVKCGKKYIAHTDHNIFNKRNIDTLYKLSFIEIRVPIENQNINNLMVHEDNRIEVSLAKHLERIIDDACGFLSVICEYEILPIYYDYSIYSEDKYVSGRVIPIWERRRIPRTSRAWPTLGINFLANVTAFLECCPISKKISRGISHLKITVYESSVELKLMAACSAIEYFYSYWFWEMGGLSNLINAASTNNPLANLHQDTIKKLKKLNNPSTDKTPYLSTVIRFFLNDLGIDWQKYMSAKVTPHFLEVRNELLHGSFVSDEIRIFQAEEAAQKLGVEILISILRKITKSTLLDLYKNLPIRQPEQDFYCFTDGWIEIKDILDESSSDKNSKYFFD